MPSTIATLGDIRGISVWINTFGKLLIKKGTFTKEEVVEELENFRDAISAFDTEGKPFVSEINNMIQTVKKF